MTHEPAVTDEPAGTAAPRRLHIVAGQPTPEETAAVTVILAALASAAGAPPQPGPGGPRSAWSDPARRLRPAVSAGPGAWRASGLPS
jgi:hypothetical protein